MGRVFFFDPPVGPPNTNRKLSCFILNKTILEFSDGVKDGNTKEEIFIIFTGTTRNGKSLLSDLLKATLGNYYTSFAANILTKERPPPSQPQPDILYLKSKRVVIGLISSN